MNAALWKLTIRQSRGLFIALAVLVGVFPCIFIWLTAQVDLTQMQSMLDNLPAWMKNMLPVEARQLLSLEGRLAFLFEHPLITLSLTGWAITRASDTVSGPLGRGNLELILAQPIPRTTWLRIHTSVTLLGAAVLSLLVWLSMYSGILLVPKFNNVNPLPYIWTTLNLLALTVCHVGITTLASTFDRYRWRTIGLVIGFFIVEFVLKSIGRAVPMFSWLQFLSFQSVFEPQRIIAAGDGAAGVALWYSAVLLGIGLGCLEIGRQHFRRRDLPAPH